MPTSPRWAFRPRRLIVAPRWKKCARADTLRIRPATRNPRMNRSLRLSLLALLALAPAVQAADLLVDNVNGYTLDSQGKLQHFQALLVDQGKVVATGDSADLAKRADGAKVLDGHGKTMLPGLIDAHGHIMDLGYALNSVDLTGTTSLDEALARIKAYATAHPDAKWIVGN